MVAYTHPELVEKIPAFIRAQGRRLFINLGTMSRNMRRMAHAIDNIGWTHFTEGKIPLLLKDLQANYLAHCPTMTTIDGWMKRFIGQLLKLTHSQWIFRNITKHHHTNGTIKLEAREDVLREVERQLDLGLEALPLECPCSCLSCSSDGIEPVLLPVCSQAE